MLVRRAMPGEALALSTLAYESKAHWNYTAAQLAAWKSDLTIDATSIVSRPTFVIEDDGQVVGFYQLCIEPMGEQTQLEHFWIKPVAMGKGYGRALLQHALGVAVERGYSQVRIDADPSAEAFYLACGSRRVGGVAAPITGQPGRVRPQLVLVANAT